MKILHSNSQINPNYNYQISHKAVFPVEHWVAEANGSYAHVAQKEVVEGFQKKLISFINSNLKKVYSDAQKLEKKLNAKNLGEKEKADIKCKLRSLYEILDVPAQRLRGYLASVDPNYRLKPVARSYYNDYYGSVDNPTSTAYVLTGFHKTEFEQKYCKELGKQRSLRKKRLESGATEEEANTPEFKKALSKYNHDGFDYVNFYPRRIKNTKGETYTLHTKFVIERDVNGKFLDYKFLDARFLPERGPDSPFVRLGIRK